MTTLILGASGATGRLLVAKLLENGKHVRAIVRSKHSMPESLLANDRLAIIQANLFEISDDQLAEYVSGCDTVVSCLGHNVSFKGIFLPPRRLVTVSVQRVCSAIKAVKPEKPIKFVLMNTAANRNRDLDEKISASERFVLALLRFFIPPHADNEDAADYLRTQVSKNDPVIKWTVVRPDSLIDEEKRTEFSLHLSPIRSALFNPGETSRINVASFMSELIVDGKVWSKWEGRMPVIYNCNR